MKRTLIILMLTALLSGCAAWKKLTQRPPKECTTSCDEYGNCQQNCRPSKPNEHCTYSCDAYGNCEKTCHK